VTAVCQAPSTGDLFLGFESGEVFCFRPRRGDILPVGCSNKAVTSLATNLDGTVVAAVWSEGEDWSLASFKREADTYYGMVSIVAKSQSRPWLCNLLAPGTVPTALLVDGSQLQRRPVNVLVPESSDKLRV